MARTKKNKEENIAASTKIAGKLSKVRTERKVQTIIDYLLDTQQENIAELLLNNPNIISFLGIRTINEYKKRTKEAIKRREQFEFTLNLSTNSTDEEIREMLNSVTEQASENPINERELKAKNNRSTFKDFNSDFRDPEVRRQKIKELQYPIVLLDPEILKHVLATELVKMFSFYPELEKKFKQIDFEENPMFSQEIRQLISFVADEFSTDDLLVSPDGEEQSYRDKNIDNMAILLNKILENLAQTGKLEQLVNNENSRNEAINELLPDDLRIVSSQETLYNEVLRIRDNLRSGRITTSDKIELAVLLRSFLNKSAHEQEFCFMSMLREKYKGGESIAAKRIGQQNAVVLIDFLDCLTTGRRIDDKSKAEVPPIDYEALIAEGEKGKETIRLEKIVESVLRKSNLLKKVDKDFKKEIVERIKETIRTETKKDPEINLKTLAIIGFDGMMYSELKELHAKEISDKIEKCVIKISEIERRYAKISPKTSFYEFITEYLGAKKNNNIRFAEKLKGLRKEKIYKEVDELYEQLRNDPELDETEVGELLKEMARHAKMDRDIFETKQQITRQIIRLEEQLRQEGQHDEIYIEHNVGRGNGSKKTKEDRNVIDIFIPGFFNLFGGHYEQGSFTESEIEELQRRYETTPESRRIAYDTNTEAFAIFAPVKLSKEQIVYLQKIARAVETLDVTGKTPEDYEIENAEEYVSYDLEKEEGIINVYAELYNLKQTNPAEYEKVRHQILLGAGLGTFRTVAAQEREAEKIALEAKAEAERLAEIQRQKEELEKAREAERAQAEELAEDEEMNSEVLRGRPEIRPGASEARKFSYAVRSGEVADIETDLQADHIIQPKGDTRKPTDGETQGTAIGE